MLSVTLIVLFASVGAAPGETLRITDENGREYVGVLVTEDDVILRVDLVDGGRKTFRKDKVRHRTERTLERQERLGGDLEVVAASGTKTTIREKELVQRLVAMEDEIRAEEAAAAEQRAAQASAAVETIEDTPPPTFFTGRGLHFLVVALAALLVGVVTKFTILG
jgi:hypothetical protein